jgi:hypothetical protein
MHVQDRSDNSALKEQRQMPLYHFSIRDGDRFEDNEGFDLPDDMSARTHAVGIIHELQKVDETVGVILQWKLGETVNWYGKYHSSCADRPENEKARTRNAPAFRTAQALTQEGEIRASSETRYPQYSQPTTAKNRNISNKPVKNFDNDARPEFIEACREPIATTAAFRGRIHGCTRTFRESVRFFSLAPRAPSIHPKVVCKRTTSRLVSKEGAGRRTAKKYHCSIPNVFGKSSKSKPRKS